MDQQTTLENSTETTRDFTARLAGMARNLARIVELQARLLAADIRRSQRGLAVTALFAALTLLLLLVAAPVALAGLGLLLAETTELSTAGGLLVAAALAVVTALACAGFGYYQWIRQREMWKASKRELQSNLEALRQAMAVPSDRETDELY